MVRIEICNLQNHDEDVKDLSAQEDVRGALGPIYPIDAAKAFSWNPIAVTTAFDFSIPNGYIKDVFYNPGN